MNTAEAAFDTAMVYTSLPGIKLKPFDGRRVVIMAAREIDDAGGGSARW